ncbi:MAG: glycosyltransferase family 9 protein [Heliobacteriaceae bacterium]|jgi:ADP-heptose:LPS heptosyltransferase|nr:glycosyltransferase family 9 protein [Heliobacteriaceae bacterium]
MSKNILALNFGGIGDEILFLPTLISLKKEFPHSKITLALESRSKGIKDLTDVIDEVFPSEKKIPDLLKLIWFARKGNFDIIISSGSNKFISVLLRLTGIKERYGYDTGALSRRILTKAAPLNKNQYAALMYHDLISPLTDQRTLLPEINVECTEKIPNSVLIHPGVSKLSVEKGITKTVPAEIWAQIANLLIENGKHVILAGGPDDEEVITEILKQVQDSGNFENHFGKTKSLRDLAKLIAKSEKFVCSDSAPLHIAAALKTKTYAIFGPTDHKKLIPPDVIVLKIPCSCEIYPCLWERRRTTCKSLDCLKINPQDAADIILR